MEMGVTSVRCSCCMVNWRSASADESNSASDMCSSLMVRSSWRLPEGAQVVDWNNLPPRMLPPPECCCPRRRFDLAAPPGAWIPWQACFFILACRFFPMQDYLRGQPLIHRWARSDAQGVWEDPLGVSLGVRGAEAPGRLRIFKKFLKKFVKNEWF